MSNVIKTPNTSLRAIDISPEEDIFYPLKGFEGLYEISESGVVKSNPKSFTITNRFGHPVYMARGEKILSPSIKRYKRVSLTKDGVIKSYSVHRLVALQFVPNPHKKPHVNHKDGDKLNNKVSNLEWCTPKENTRHAYDNNLIDMSNAGKHRIGVMPQTTRMVIDTETGIFYQSMKEAELAIGVAPHTLRSYLNSNRIKSGRADYLRKRFVFP